MTEEQRNTILKALTEATAQIENGHHYSAKHSVEFAAAQLQKWVSEELLKAEEEGRRS